MRSLVVPALCVIMTPLLVYWIETLKKWAVRFPVEWVRRFCVSITGGWRTKLTTFISGILLGVLFQVAILIGAVDVIREFFGIDLSPFVGLKPMAFVACGAYVALQNIGLYSAGRSITKARMP